MTVEVVRRGPVKVRVRKLSRPTLIWVTKDGTEISVRKMQTSHIINCMRMLRGYSGYEREMRAFRAELKWRENTQLSDSVERV